MHHHSQGGRGPWERAVAAARGRVGEGDPGLGAKPQLRSHSSEVAVGQLPSRVTADSPCHLSGVSIARCTIKRRRIQGCVDSHPARGFLPSYQFRSLILTLCHLFNSRPWQREPRWAPCTCQPLPAVGSHVTFPGCVILKYCKSLTIILPLDIVSCVIVKGNT